MSTTREDLVREHITKDQKGIEVGPWFSPMTPKRAGYNCLALDVFDGHTLRQRAAVDPNIPKDKIGSIEEVDLVGTSTEIAQLVSDRNELGTFDYIVSSHNFEHLPNPIKFLQGCGKVLKPNGWLSMAIPDRRACFDRYKSNSRLSEWIAAYFEDRKQPTLAQVFDMSILSSLDPPKKSVPQIARSLKEAFESWSVRKDLPETPYQDVHCWTFTPTSFELLIIESGLLGLSPFVPVHVSKTMGNEFFVHLKHVGYLDGSEKSAEFYDRRQTLFEALRAESNLVEKRWRKFHLWK